MVMPMTLGCSCILAGEHALQVALSASLTSRVDVVCALVMQSNGL